MAQMTGRIDVHSHLLPNVDDGCPSAEDSVACARWLAAAGYTHIFCTPHVLPEMPNRASGIAQGVRVLQGAMDKAGVGVTLLPGGEINIGRMWPALAEIDPLEVPTFCNARRHVLLDFWGEALPDGFEQAIGYLQRLGLTVTLAHPERLKAFQNAEWLWREVAAMGIRFQGNLQCFSDPADAPTRVLIEKHAREGTYWLLGSDCHWPETLDVRLNGLRVAIELLGDDVADRLTRVNPRELLPAGL
jgi:protein-tyrosine phosphatase